MSFVFVTTSHDYADEFDVEGAFALPKPHFETQLRLIEKGFKDGVLVDKELYFGTNEYLSFSSFEDFMDGVTVKECTEQFYDEFKALTGYAHLGEDVFGRLLDNVEDDGE